MNIGELEAFLDGSQAIVFAVASNKDERYQFVEKILKRFNYPRLKRQDKGIVIKFLQKITGYSRQQITRMIKRFIDKGKLERHQTTSNGFKKVYTEKDIQILAQIDHRHDTPNGLMIKKLCERAYEQFHDDDYKRLSTISVSHIYNFRQSEKYKKIRTHYTKTKGSTKATHIGERRKPRPDNKPGYIRIDTVHQGDLDGKKGVYHINAVDEVTQFEIVITIEKVSEAYLIPALEFILDAFPFEIINFHSDNGSEYVNKTVASLLSKLLIEFTKSRPRHSNDNALAEGKNAAIVRKVLGYIHIPQHYAKKVNEFNKKALNPYINFHRPCLYPTITFDKKGKQRKKYEYKNMATPYEKFKSLEAAETYLKEGLTFKELDDIAYVMSDNEAADFLQEQRSTLFKEINDGCKKSA